MIFDENTDAISKLEQYLGVELDFLIDNGTFDMYIFEDIDFNSEPMPVSIPTVAKPGIYAKDVYIEKQSFFESSDPLVWWLKRSLPRKHMSSVYSLWKKLVDEYNDYHGFDMYTISRAIQKGHLDKLAPGDLVNTSHLRAYGTWILDDDGTVELVNTDRYCYGYIEKQFTYNVNNPIEYWQNAGKNCGIRYIVLDEDHPRNVHGYDVVLEIDNIAGYYQTPLSLNILT